MKRSTHIFQYSASLECKVMQKGFEWTAAMKRNDMLIKDLEYEWLQLCYNIVNLQEAMSFVSTHCDAIFSWIFHFFLNESISKKGEPNE